MKILCFFLICISIITVFADYYSECDGVPNETYVASLDSCELFIYCDRENSIEGPCPEGYLFNAEMQYCDEEKNVECFNRVVTPSLIETTTTTAKTTTMAPTTKVEIKTTTTTPIKTKTTESTKFELITSTTNQMKISTSTNSWILKECPENDDLTHIIYIQSNDSCSDYYVCYHGQKVKMHCTDDLHFNHKTSQCDYPQNVKCTITEKQLSLSVKDCQSHVVGLFPHPNRCEYFYNCQHGFLILQQCPFYHGWDFEKRTCLPKKQAKCYKKPKI